MIRTVHQVVFVRGEEERVVLETTDLKEARERDAQLETAMSLLQEAERLIKSGSIRLPKGLGYDHLEMTLEDLFIGFAENRDGMRRAIKGETYSPEKAEPSLTPARKRSKKTIEDTA